MLVKDRMSYPVITVSPKTTLWDAHRLIQKEHVRRFPVINKRGHLMGIVSASDLLNASPSPATSLSVYEVNCLLSKITVKKVMTTEVITISEDTPLEEAARRMADNKIGGLPVIRDHEVVGIVTETDLFKILLELSGARGPGVSLTCLVPNMPEQLAQLTKAIFEVGGNILALGTFLGKSSENREIALKVDGITPQSLESVVEPFTEKILDIRKSILS
jgi:acetoin utilization protein AcuB